MHNLETRTKRLLRLERRAQGNTIVLSEAQVALLERHSVNFRCRHVENSRPGELLNQDTIYWGTLKGVGKVYVQVVIDTFCSLAFAKVYKSKMPITACDLLWDRVLPFYEALGEPVAAILTDNGREFCGRPEKHPYELLLTLEEIEHRTTKVRSPRTNGFVERMNRTLLGKCFRVTGRTTWYGRLTRSRPTSTASWFTTTSIESKPPRLSAPGKDSRTGPPGGPRDPGASVAHLLKGEPHRETRGRVIILPRGRMSENYPTCTTGLDEVPYLDNTTIMDLEALPSHVLVLGGGYVGLELMSMPTFACQGADSPYPL